MCQEKLSAATGRFAPASVKAVVGIERMTPSAREVMLGITADLASQFLLLVKVLSTQAVDKIMRRSTLKLWIGNRAFRKPSREST